MIDEERKPENDVVEHSVPEGSAAGHAVAAVEAVPEGILSSRRTSAIVMGVSVPALIAAMAMAEVLGAFWRIPAVALGGAALVAFTLSLWGVVLGPRMADVLRMLKSGRVTPKTVAVALGMLVSGVGVIALGIFLVVSVATIESSETVQLGNVVGTGKMDSNGRPDGKWVFNYSDGTKALTLGYGYTCNEMWIENSPASPAHLDGAVLAGFILREGALAGATFVDVDFSDSDMQKANLAGAVLAGCKLRNTTLVGANLSGADLRGTDLSGANLRRANLQGADLSRAVVAGARFGGAAVDGVTWTEVDKSGATFF